jgi:hypothetical protein
MDWYASCAYAPRRKRCFHRTSRSRLRELAKALCLSSGSFDLRSNAGGIAVSGEIILHCEQVYVHVSQPATGADAGILIRTCRGRKDYTGGRNYFAPLSMLDDPAALAVFVRRLIVAEPEG